ncbi:ABC transporter permease subunit [Cytobacillus praedii]|uniref:ABC transporter permease subunit n=1 Tax=Cytobacillus praedii TaxID=1742358 RepID=UPI003F7F0A66
MAINFACFATILQSHEKKFIRALRACGISEKTILWNHLFPNASLPFLFFIGMSLCQGFTRLIKREPYTLKRCTDGSGESS